MRRVTPQPTTGRLIVIQGSMFAGKTEQVIALLRRAMAEGKRTMAVKHVIDNRYDPEHLVTHRQDRYDAVRVSNAAAIPGVCQSADVVAIDEGHFFKMALVPIVRQLLSSGRTVIVAGISHDAWGRPFEPMPRLAEIADEVVTMEAPCRVCGKPSPFTQRMTPVNPSSMVGGLNDYEPRCAEHFTPLPGPAERR